MKPCLSYITHVITRNQTIKLLPSCMLQHDWVSSINILMKNNWQDKHWSLSMRSATKLWWVKRVIDESNDLTQCVKPVLGEWNKFWSSLSEFWVKLGSRWSLSMSLYNFKRHVFLFKWVLGGVCQHRFTISYCMFSCLQITYYSYCLGSCTNKILRRMCPFFFSFTFYHFCRELSISLCCVRCHQMELQAFYPVRTPWLHVM